jgi:1,4-dihydroxy-2-naphthoate octaprenyltransferase
LLAPVYLWGWLVAGGGLSPGVALGFIAFHLFLYSGATAFNSYYDRDVGPVGGLAHPPRVPPELLAFSLAVQAVGWVMAALVNWPFFMAYSVFLVLSVAYSHPAVRFKAHTLTSLVVVGFGQGALAFAAAWAATRGEIGSMLSLDGLLGATAAVFLILALYPLTQLYQIDEDAARGDRTIAVAFGAATAFTVSLVCTSIGGAAIVAVVARKFGLVDAIVVALGLAAQMVVLLVWRTRFNPDQVLRNYRRVMRLNVVNAAALGAYLLARLASPS